MHRLKLLKGGRDLPAPHCKKAPNKNGKWDITIIKLITQTQLPPCPLRPGPGNSTEIHSISVLCWGGMQLVASENGSQQVGLGGHCSAHCFHIQVCSWHLTSPPFPGSLSAAPQHNVHGIQEWGLQWPGSMARPWKCSEALVALRLHPNQVLSDKAPKYCLCTASFTTCHRAGEC